jgi:hypothetical protein
MESQRVRGRSTLFYIAPWLRAADPGALTTSLYYYATKQDARIKSKRYLIAVLNPAESLGKMTVQRELIFRIVEKFTGYRGIGFDFDLVLVGVEADEPHITTATFVTLNLKILAVYQDLDTLVPRSAATVFVQCLWYKS